MDFNKTPGTYSLRHAICAESAACIQPTIQTSMKKYIFLSRILKINKTQITNNKYTSLMLFFLL